MTRLALLVRGQSTPETPPPPLPPKGDFEVAELWKYRDLTTMSNWDNQAKAATFDGGTYATKAGFHRDVPLTGPLTGEWGPAHFATDIADAKSGGVDGLLADITNPRSTDANYQRGLKLVTAAGVAGGFTVIPWLDINGGAFNGIPGSGTSSAMTPEAVAVQIAGDFCNKGVDVFDGAHWIGSFKAEGDSTGKIAGIAYATYWVRFLTKLRSLVTDLPIKFWPCVLYPTTANFTAFGTPRSDLGNTRIADMISWWGPANPAHIAGMSTWATLAHNLGMEWGHPQRDTNDVRPYSANYAESENTKLGRDGWASAIATGAKFVLGSTWNDYAENTHKQPSRDLGRAVLWFNKFFSDWWRTGVMPTITEDKIILINRNQSSNATITTSGLTATAHTLDGGGTFPYDKTEALVFLTAPADVYVNGVNQGTKPAGVTSVLVNLATGIKQTAEIRRSGVTVKTVTSDDIPGTSAPRPDKVYRWKESA